MSETKTTEVLLGFWRTVALTMTHLFVGLLGGIIALLVSAHTPILAYYHDASLIDRRLADLETRVDRNDARHENRYDLEKESQLQIERRNYQPLLEGAKRDHGRSKVQ